MQGLDQVRDGSAHEQKDGYWLCNVSAANRDGSVLIPLYFRLYSHRKESIGENGQILKAINQVMTYAPKDLIWVMDQSMDRSVFYDALVKKDYNYLIRQNGVRHLVYQGEKIPLKQINYRIKPNLKYCIRVWSHIAGNYVKARIWLGESKNGLMIYFDSFITNLL